MNRRNNRLSAQGKGILPLILGLAMVVLLTGSAPIVARGETTTSPLHAAAVIKKGASLIGHGAASSLLPVVNQDDILPAQRILADQVLRALPSYCRDNLKNFYVNYDPKNVSRGLGGDSTIIVTGNVPDKEFMALITHECGHVTDLGGLHGHASAGTSSFYDGPTPIFSDDPSVAFYSISWSSPKANQPGTRSADFVSGYAASDPFEDFAETFAYYALQQKAFAAAAKKDQALLAKYNFMQNVVFSVTGPVAEGQSVRGKSVPWDVTKLPYVWHAKK